MNTTKATVIALAIALAVCIGVSMKQDSEDKANKSGLYTGNPLCNSVVTKGC